MKLLVFSDTHGNDNYLNAMKKHDYDMALHAGDSLLKDASKFDYIVRGNCDYEDFDNYEVIEVSPHKILLLHGHSVDINYSNNVVMDAQELGCDIIIHGHTHKVRCEYVDNILILNPGSTQSSRDAFPESYMYISITSKIKVELYQADTNQYIDTLL